MTFLSCLTEEDDQLVLDSSVAINILATGFPIRILEALKVPAMIPETVVREIEDGERSGRRGATLISELIEGQALQVVALDVTSLPTFASLVSGSASESLGDGEAATIAVALATRSSAVIDEKKATRLSQGRYDTLRLATTVDILSHGAVLSMLGQCTLAEATLRALRDARMQVREHQFDWVLDLIGLEGVAQCPSLRRLAGHHARRLPLKAAG